MRIPCAALLRRLPAVGVGVLLLLPSDALWAAAGRVSNPKPGSTVDIDEPTKPGEDPGKAQPGVPERALQDTVWIADWSFDSGGCNGAGWVHYDNRILNDGTNYWAVDNRFAGVGGIVNKAAVLSKHDLFWGRDGYGNAWDYSIILKYSGAAATLSFDKVADSEPGWDFVTVEADSLGLSESSVDYAVNPNAGPAAYRTVLLTTGGNDSGSHFGPIALPNFGPGTHEVYVRFASDESGSDEDHRYPSAIRAGLVVDNISVTGGLVYFESFEGALNANVTLANTAPATPFGEFARLFQHITDNDKATENTSCAWLFTDPLRIAFFPDMAFGPGQAVIRNGIDDILVSPWVSLASTPGAKGTVLSFRVFPGNRFTRGGKIVQSWRVRSKLRLDNTDTAAPFDSVDVVSPWKMASNTHLTLDSYHWQTQVYRLTKDVAVGAREVQVATRVADWRTLTGDTPPVPLDPGPGPYVDRVRIGRRVLTGPALSGVSGPEADLDPDDRTQAQDAFPTAHNAIAPGEHFSPDGSNRFGTCAFSQGGDLGINGTTYSLVTGDSIVLEDVVDARGAGGIASVRFYGTITSGAHAGKAPAPYTVGANGFFEVSADSARASNGVAVNGTWFVDLDDTYFRGGDALKYFWAATDNASGFSSSPGGLSGLPVSVTAAEVATSGLYEVNFLPTINWAPAYLARIAADAHGDLDPTPGEIAASTQKNCILYVQKVLSGRRSGIWSRTSFMYTMDELGYRGAYDVYDVQGSGNSNNALGGRANVAQASGYALIVHDDGRSTVTPNIPDGISTDNEKINQAQWYRDYLAQGVSGLAGTATLWILGEDTAFQKSTNPLFTTDLGLATIVTDQALSVNPDVQGGSSFTWANGGNTSFVGDKFSLHGGTPVIRAYDGAGASGTAVVTHNYKAGATTGTGAIVMNKNSVLKWNTVWMGFGWFDIRETFGSPPAHPQPETQLMTKIFSQTLPFSCQHALNPVDAGDPTSDAVPAVTALRQNVPNPFNPTTTIHFDLAHTGPVLLRVYDTRGRLVRTLVDSALRAGRQRVTWNGMSTAGQRAPSGVYFARLVTDDTDTARKMVLLQ